MTKKESSMLKGIAIIMMFMHHLFTDAIIYETLDIHFILLKQDQLMWLGGFGKVCVALFVFISGYGITKSIRTVSERNMAGYIARRYISLILPFMLIYLLALIAAVISGMFTLTYGTDMNALYYAAVDALGLSNLLGTPTLNGTWWYMSLAVTLVLLIPMLNYVYNRFGAVGTLLLGILLPVYIGNGEFDSLRWYMMTVVAGIVCARESLLGKLRRRCNTRAKHIILLAVTLAGIFFCAQMRWFFGHYWILDAILAVLFAILVFYIARIPIVSSALVVLGEHSMNIFLTHSFLFYYYCRGFIYGFRYPFLIFLALLLTSLALSALIELLKKVIRFERIERAAIARLSPRPRAGEQSQAND